MLSKTILDTAKAVTGELGLVQPTALLSSLVLTDIQLKYLIEAAGDELLDLHDWQGLVKQHSFTVTSSPTYALPTDLHRMVDQTCFIGETELRGAPSEARWQRLQSGDSTFKLIANQFQLYDPDRFIGQTVSFKYITKNYIVDGTTGLLKDQFSLDSDKTIYHPRLLTTFVKLKFQQTKNFDTRASAEDFNSSLQSAIANDTTSPVLSYEGNTSFESDWYE